MSVRALLAGCAALSLGLSITPAAHAYRRLGSQFNPRSVPIPYRINRATIPASLGEATGVAAIEAGMQTWAAPACSAWRTTNAGNTSLTRARAGDRENSFLWISGAWPGELGSVNVTIGVTTPVWNQGGFVIDADIQYNAVGFRWSTTGTNNTVDTQSIATHENGHFLGLDHTPISRAVMFASYPGGARRALDADDTAGVCALYPSGQAVPDAGTPPQPDDPCAQFTSCAGCTPVNGCGWCGATGRCVSSTQTGPVAGSCASGFAWFPQQCTTTPPPTDAGPATDPCTRNTSCGACTPVNGCGWCGATNRCVTSTPTGPVSGTCASGFAWQPQECTAGMASFGEPCRTLQDCNGGGICVGSTTVMPFCTRVCADDCQCPRGYNCGAMLQTGQRVCVPGTNRCAMDAGVPTPVDAGNPVPTDTGVIVPRDTGVAPRDTGNPVATDTGNPTPSEDAGIAPMDDAGVAEDTGLTEEPTGSSSNGDGCGCRAVGTQSTRSAWSGLAAALGAAVALRRRRRRQAD
jgi:MYXO-CTERM domain-containing protein